MYAYNGSYQYNTDDQDAFPPQREKHSAITLALSITALIIVGVLLYRASLRSYSREKAEEYLEKHQVVLHGQLSALDNVKVPSKENDSTDSTEVNGKGACAKSAGVLPEPVVRFFQIFNPINWVKNILDFLKYTIQFFQKPGWKTLSEIMETDHIEKRPERLCPSDWDCKSHNLGVVQDTMGASCLVFFLPGCVGAYMALTGQMSHCALGGVILSVFLAYVSSMSFLADYWYMGDKPDQEVPDCQKQVIFNKIDRVNVPIIGFVCSSIGLIQFLWARGMNWAYPLLFVVFVSAAAVQYFSLDHFNNFARIAYAPDYDHEQPSDEAAQALSTGLQMHIIWHILACIPPIVQMYGLMVYGLVLPSWLRCLSC